MATSRLVKRVLRTGEVEEAESTISTTYEPTSIEITPRNDFEFTLDAALLERVMVGRLQVRIPSRVFGNGPSDVYHICVPLSGRVICRGADDAPRVIGPGQASLWAPGQVPDTVWSAGTTQMCFMIPPALVEQELEAMTGTILPKPVGLASFMDLRSATGQSWWRLVDLLAGELAANSGLIEQGVARRHIERLLIDGLLLGNQHVYIDELRRRAMPGAAAQAIELIEEDPAASWTVLELARRVHVSVRTLQEAFQRERGISPMSYLRRARLHRVREELRESPAGSVTVRAVAERWGFLHMGRFSAHYRREFHELPSETLRRDGTGRSIHASR